MLAKRISETIRGQIAPEFENRNHALPQTVEAKVRRLVADRGQGGHLNVEISWLLADEMRQRVRRWAEIVIGACQPKGVSVDDLGTVLSSYAAEDWRWIASMMQEKYRWLKLNDQEIDFAMKNQIEIQAVSAVPRVASSSAETSSNWRWLMILASLATIAAGAIAAVRYFGG